MKLLFILILIVCTLSSCKTSNSVVVKKSVSTKNKSKPDIIRNYDKIKGNDTLDMSDHSTTTTHEVTKAAMIIDYAKQFSGVKYQFGGNSFEGMDCSGLVFESFKTVDILLPRISRDMAKHGEKITLNETQNGDLLFFKTSNRRHTINHVGLVVSSEDGTIEFIHSTSSAGVIISKLSENYWHKAFVEARRIL